MATFYLLPPRRTLGVSLTSWFPGLAWDGRELADLAETLAEAVRAHPDVYVVYQEELTEADNAAASLVRDFGAEAGDQVVEVSAVEGVPQVRRWRLPGTDLNDPARRRDGDKSAA